MRKVGAHWPTNKASCLRPMTLRGREVAMEAPAAHKKMSDGNFAVSRSMAVAAFPSGNERAATLAGEFVVVFIFSNVERSLTAPCYTLAATSASVQKLSVRKIGSLPWINGTVWN